METQRLGVAPESAWILNAGQIAIRTELDWANTFVKQTEYLIDAESRRALLSLDYGAGDDLELGFSLDVNWVGGGELDHFIRSWHEWFNLPEGKRESVEDNEFNIYGTIDDGTGFRWEDKGTSLGNLVLSARYILASQDTEARKFASTLAFDLSLPTTTNSTYGHYGVDFGLTLQNSWTIQKWQGHLGFGLLGMTNSEIDGVSYRTARAQGFIGVDYGVTDQLRLGLNSLIGQGAVDNVPTYADAFTYLDIGLFWNLSDCSFKAIVRENPWPSDRTSDVAFIIGLDAKFAGNH